MHNQYNNNTYILMIQNCLKLCKKYFLFEKYCKFLPFDTTVCTYIYIYIYKREKNLFKLRLFGVIIADVAFAQIKGTLSYTHTHIYVLLYSKF